MLDYNYKQHLPGYAFALCLMLAVLTIPVSSLASEKTYSFGVVPQQSATRLARSWIPLLQELQQQTGITLRFATAPDIPTFEKRLARGEYDFAYMNPYHYTVFHQHPGYRAFARQGNKRITGILVVRKDSAYNSVDDLQDQVIAFPAPAAFAATLLVTSHLNKKGVKFKPKYVSSHDSVYRAVVSNFASAGGGIARTLESIDPQARDQLKILWKSQGYTPHAFAVHPRISSDVVDQLQQGLEKLTETQQGNAVLKNINFKVIESATDADWDDVRDLHINILLSED